MAAPVDTNNEGDGESQMDQWLEQNRLLKVRGKFKQMQVIFEDLVDLSSSSIDDLKAYARDELGLNLMDANRFAKAVASLKPKKKKDRIVLSAEEGVAIENIEQRQKETRARITKETNNINTLAQVAKANEDEANRVRKVVINAVNKRFDDLISRCNVERGKKEEMITKHVEELKTYDKALTDANAKCDELLEDGTMDKLARKRRIVGVSQNVLKTQMKDVNVTPKIKIKMNENEILKYIESIGSVNSFGYPQAPNIKVENVQSTAATVRVMMMNEIEATYECALELCDDYALNDDEKKNEIQWKQMSLIKAKKEENLTQLKQDMVHGVRARYKNEQGFGSWCKPVTFKTKKILITIPSSILTETEICTLGSLLQQSGKGLSDKRWSLLYRGSRDGFTANVFHNKCDGKAKTLSIIRTDSNNVFGGYASVPWTSNGGYAADNDAFILLIRSSKNYPPQVFTQKEENKQYAVFQYSSYMCIFGGGHDIHVTDNCNTNSSSFVNGNITYMNLPTRYY
eukprot:1076576_1